MILEKTRTHSSIIPNCVLEAAYQRRIRERLDALAGDNGDIRHAIAHIMQSEKPSGRSIEKLELIETFLRRGETGKPEDMDLIQYIDIIQQAMNAPTNDHPNITAPWKSYNQIEEPAE